MKKTVTTLFFCCVYYCNPLIGNQVVIQTVPAVQTTQEEIDSMAGIVLHHFGNIVNNFFNIVKDPHNANNVGQNVTGILSNIVTIAAQAFRSGKLSLDATPEEIMMYAQEQSESLCAPIMRITRNKMKNLEIEQINN